MKTLRRVSVVVVLWMVLMPLFAEASGEEADARAAPESDRAEEMAAWSVDSGGGESSGGDFSLTAAIGQPDAGQLSQGSTVLDGGLWAGAADLQILYCDGFETGDTGAWTSVVGGTE